MKNVLALSERVSKLQIIQEVTKINGKDFLTFSILALKLQKIANFNT